MIERVATNEVACEAAVAELRRLFAKHGYVAVKYSTEQKRTLTQNRALHLWCKFMADTLNDAGLDMRRAIRDEVDLPWSEATVKEHIWKPLQAAMLQKQSTTEANRTDYTKVHAVICRHFGEKFGLSCPEWPKKQEAA